MINRFVQGRQSRAAVGLPVLGSVSVAGGAAVQAIQSTGSAVYISQLGSNRSKEQAYRVPGMLVGIQPGISYPAYAPSMLR